MTILAVLQLLLGATTVMVRADGEATVADCRSWGLDPDQLACGTCQLLPVEHVRHCQQCCQSWLDTKRITKPYEAAVLVDRSGGGGGDVATFVDEDWDEVRKVKGSSRLHRIKAETGQHNFFYSRPSQLLFFDKPISSNEQSDITGLSREAVETVNLDGMKREDMKDMLLTLLP